MARGGKLLRSCASVPARTTKTIHSEHPMTILKRALVAGALFSGAAFATPPGTIHVATNGVDSAACGSFQAPCRTITRGLDRAQAGDTVLVRAGRYGDV